MAKSMIASSAKSRFFKVVAMITRRLYPVILVLIIGCQQPGIGQNPQPDAADRTIAQPRPDKQLELNKQALLNKGSSEEMRIDAANLMLFSENPLAREILLNTLKQSENRDARIAVCKSLIQARVSKKERDIRNKGDFIRPLLDILTAEADSAEVKLAAEAILIFEYEQMSELLGKLATNTSLPVEARLNIIYALKLQPDMGAIFQLMDLLDDPDSKVTGEAEKALNSLGIPVGKDAFLLDRLNRQEEQMRNLKTELGLWKKRYLDSLDSIYNGIGDDEAKGKFLAEQLGSSEAMVKLWSLEKVSQRRVGTSKLPPKLGPLLVKLIADENRDVRLQTAKLLSLMGEVDSAKPLLKQLENEKDDEVRMEVFVALGAACHYAFSPDTKIKVPVEIRKQTLEWAVKYLADVDGKKAQKGGEVIKKLLKQNRLTPEDVDRYLGLLVKRFEQEKDKETDGALRGELLSAMAGLCDQGVHKEKARKLFMPLFEAALSDKTNPVREAAVDGLIYVDKTQALKKLRQGFVNDSSAIVRKKLIELAGEVGGKEDLVWIAERIGSTAESELAWQVMLRIFKRLDAAVLGEWIGKFESKSSKTVLSDAQRISLLEMAEGKADGENRLEMLKDIRKKLADAYSKSGKYEQAAKRLGLLYEAAEPDEKEAVSADLLDVYLRWPNLEDAKDLVENFLLQGDLEPNSVVILSIDKYLKEPPGGADPNAVLGALAGIKIPDSDARPMWAEQLKLWSEQFSPLEARDPNEPKKAPK